MLLKTTVLATLIALAALVPPSLAQAPKPGKEYVDSVDLGFKIKMPDGWDFIPPQPGEVNEIGKFSNGTAGILRNPKNGQPIWAMEVQLLKFDRRPKPAPKTEGDDKDKHVIDVSDFGPKEFTAWTGKLRGGWKQKEKKDQAVGKVAATRYIYTATIDEIDCAFVAYEYKLKPDLDVVAVFFGPGDEKHWSKYESPCDAMGKSFKTVEVAAGATPAARSAAPRDQRRAELEKEIAKSQGWMLYETPNYFVISAKNDDREFIKELMDRLEAIHSVYEEKYPVALAMEMRELVKKREAAAPPDPKDEKKPGEPDVTVAGTAVDPAALASCSVVRVCKDHEQYSSYGGPPNSAGYWSSNQHELVIFDDQGNGGRRNTWAVINHEAFHQYIYYFFGELAPHSWYNEGTGDFFSGYQYEHKKFTLKAFDWRERTIQENINKGTFVPLKTLVRYTQAEYYGNNKLGLGGGENYAQGWSFIYFLRTGAKSSKCWNPAWNTILDVYLRTLVETNDLDQAVDKAFAGIDWDALESCWKDYILKG